MSGCSQGGGGESMAGGGISSANSEAARFSVSVGFCFLLMWSQPTPTLLSVVGAGTSLRLDTCY